MADLVEKLSAFEDGLLDLDQICDLFQSLINTGLAYRLQGSIGRTAEHMIELGYCRDPVPGDEWDEDDDLSEDDAYRWSPALTGA
jgi:hypothetical protein